MAKIDIVVSWLDDGDPVWRSEFNQYKGIESVKISEESANNEARFRDYNTFKYWFRAIETNAPWVNKVYLVTFGHLPKWLNTDHPKLVVVRHEEFIPKEYLPTFSSATIALNLHRIEGLSETFVYFNDDMFLINPTKPTDFFKEDVPCDMLTLVPAQTYEEFNHFAINNMELIHKEFSKKEILKKNIFKMINFKTSIPYLGTTLLQLPYPNISDILHFHLSTPLNKSIYDKLWQRQFKKFDEACKSRFRNTKDVTDWYIRMYSLCSGNFVPKNMYKFGRIINLKNAKGKFKHILNSKLKEVCLNDAVDLSGEEFNDVMYQMKQAFEEKFPQKSEYESCEEK